MGRAVEPRLLEPPVDAHEAPHLRRLQERDEAAEGEGVRELPEVLLRTLPAEPVEAGEVDREAARAEVFSASRL